MGKNEGMEESETLRQGTRGVPTGSRIRKSRGGWLEKARKGEIEETVERNDRLKRTAKMGGGKMVRRRA